jgi:Leucine-rich repeat (LRR) protein
VTLDFSSRALHAIPKQILALPYLHSLDLSHNYLSTVSLYLGPLSTLRCLRLSNNLMTSLPLHLVNALPHFAHLTELSISHNKLWYLEKFPPSVAQSLTHLDISHNAFSQLPPHLFNLTALTTLNISHNQFCDPKGISAHAHTHTHAHAQGMWLK